MEDRTKHDGQTYYCNYCLHGYYRQDLLHVDDHIKNCSINEPQKVEMPEERDKWLKFKNYHKGLPVPRIIVAYFECYVPNVSIKTGSQTEKISKTCAVRVLLYRGISR